MSSIVMKRIELIQTVVPLDLPQIYCDGLGVIELCGPVAHFLPYVCQFGAGGRPERVAVIRMTVPLVAVPDALAGMSAIPMAAAGGPTRRMSGH